MEPEEGHSPLVWFRWRCGGCSLLLSSIQYVHDIPLHDEATYWRGPAAGSDLDNVRRNAISWILRESAAAAARTAHRSRLPGDRDQGWHSAPDALLDSPNSTSLSRSLQPDREMDGTFLLLRHPRHCRDEGSGRQCCPRPRPLARSLTLRDEK